jgi:hypothetical protein
MDLTALAPLPLSPQLNVKIEPNADLDNMSSTYSPVSTSSHNLNGTSFNNLSCDGIDGTTPTALLTGTPSAAAAAAAATHGSGLNYKNLFQYQQQINANSNKIRKRSANQAYEYLTSLPDSKTFQEWLVSNETDFTWVHKRNSMTNAGKKYYYICNYRIKKGFMRCPAVIYALFPNNEDSTVMVYSCGDHDHRRIDQTKPTCDGLLSRNSLLSFFNSSQQSNQHSNDLTNNDQEDDDQYDDEHQPVVTQVQSQPNHTVKRQKTYHNSNSNDLLSTSSPSSSPLSSISVSTSPVLQQQQQQQHSNGSRHTPKDQKRPLSLFGDPHSQKMTDDQLTIENIMNKMNYEAFAAVAAAAAVASQQQQSPQLHANISSNPTSQLNNIINSIQ